MNSISRRTFVATSAAGALVAAGALSGCAQETPKETKAASRAEEFDVLRDYLPIGSVVSFNISDGSSVQFMIVSRRPDVTTVANETNENVELSAIYDYAAVQWPLGFVTDLSLQGQGAECVGFYREDISHVDFVGCEDGREQEAKELLNAAYGTMNTCATVLLPMEEELVENFPDVVEDSQ